ncbi:MAG: hypothetical protein AAB416_03580 [Patescibacteria group bacterium]
MESLSKYGAMKLLRIPEESEVRDAVFPPTGGPRQLSLQIHWMEPAMTDGVPDHVKDPVRKSDTIAVAIESLHFEPGPNDAETRKVRGRHNGRRITIGWIPSTHESSVEYEEVW